MKTKKLTKGTIGFVEVPNDATDFLILDDGDLYYKSDFHGLHIGHLRTLEKGNWTILGDSNSLTEEQIKLLGLDLEQYKSLKQELCICDENPYRKPNECDCYGNIECCAGCEHTYVKYNEAQSKVIKYITLFKED